MVTIASLKAWGLAASLLASNHHARLSDAVLTGMARAAIARPITASDEGIRVMMGYEVALAWFEGHNQDGQPHGSNDGGDSFCWAQINLPHGARTFDGWTGRDLVQDPDKCAMAAALIIRSSVSDRRAPADCPLCIYARGFRWVGNDAILREARGLSKHRADLARRLLREVPWREVDDEKTGPVAQD